MKGIVFSVYVYKNANAADFGLYGGNGAISITTRRGSTVAPAIRLNTATLAPLGFQASVEFYAPVYDTPESKDAWTPDYRTTIYRKPDLLVSNEGKASLEFYTSSLSAFYSVVIEGLSNDGKIIWHMETIEVR